MTSGSEVGEGLQTLAERTRRGLKTPTYEVFLGLFHPPEGEEK